MPLPAPLLALQARLRRHGEVVVATRDTLEVRFALLTRVRLSYAEGRLRCAPYIGFLPRTRASVLVLGVLTAFGAWSFYDQGVTPAACASALAAIMGAIYECVRNVVLEGGLARVHLHWAAVEPEVAALPDGAGVPAMAPLPRPAWGDGSPVRPSWGAAASAPADPDPAIGTPGTGPGR